MGSCLVTTGQSTFHFRLLLTMFVLHLSLVVSCLFPLAHSLSVVSPACAACQPPTFPPGGRVLYLPHCVRGTSLNYCQAVCSGEKISATNQGSCENCETKCGMVFLPVCSEDQEIIYASKCQAECAGASPAPCTGLQTVIPGKTKLPPSHQLPMRLQTFGGEEERLEGGQEDV